MLMITSKIDKTVEKYYMLSEGDFVAVGVSGGADSMLLLRYLLEKREVLNLRLLVLNVEHGIREETSQQDTAFVKHFCEENEVEFSCLSINAPQEAASAGMGVEEYSRKRRYEFFKSFGADKIATAHSLSDNVETLLFRLSRGTAVKGCCGIPAVRGNIIRPLIECTSAEIRLACRKEGIPFVIDETNSDNAYARNYIRNKIVPDFERLNPSFEKAAMRLIQNANETEEYMMQQTADCFEQCYADNSLQLKELRQYHPAVIKRVIIRMLAENGVTLDELHLSGVYALLNKQGKYQIKNNLFAVSDKCTLRLAVFEKTVDFEKITVNKKIISKADFLNNCELLKKEFAFYCDYDKISGDLTVRSRKSGDRISPAGRNVSKSLKKFYNEEKIPVEERENIPVLCDENGIIGIYGRCCDESVKIDNTTQSVLLININL